MTTKNNHSDLPSTAQRHLENAYQLGEEAKLEAALEECEAAIALNPGWAEAHNLRGVILDDLQDTEGAIEAYRQAVQLDPEFEEARDNLAEAEGELDLDAAKDILAEEADAKWQLLDYACAEEISIGPSLGWRLYKSATVGLTFVLGPEELGKSTAFGLLLLPCLLLFGLSMLVGQLGIELPTAMIPTLLVILTLCAVLGQTVAYLVYYNSARLVINDEGVSYRSFSSFLPVPLLTTVPWQAIESAELSSLTPFGELGELLYGKSDLLVINSPRAKRARHKVDLRGLTMKPTQIHALISKGIERSRTQWG